MLLMLDLGFRTFPR